MTWLPKQILSVSCHAAESDIANHLVPGVVPITGVSTVWCANSGDWHLSMGPGYTRLEKELLSQSCANL